MFSIFIPIYYLFFTSGLNIPKEVELILPICLSNCLTQPELFGGEIRARSPPAHPELRLLELHTSLWVPSSALSVFGLLKRLFEEVRGGSAGV